MDAHGINIIRCVRNNAPIGRPEGIVTEAVEKSESRSCGSFQIVDPDIGGGAAGTLQGHVTSVRRKQRNPNRSARRTAYVRRGNTELVAFAIKPDELASSGIWRQQHE